MKPQSKYLLRQVWPHQVRGDEALTIGVESHDGASEVPCTNKLALQAAGYMAIQPERILTLNIFDLRVLA